MNDNEKRDELYRSVYEAFVGPMDPSSTETLASGEGPLQKYSAGVLFPQGDGYDDVPDVEVEDGEDVEAEASGDIDVVAEAACSSSERAWASAELSDEPIALSNAQRQSAMSISFAAKKEDSISIQVNAGKYESDSSGSSGLVYKRIPLEWKSDSVAVSDVIREGKAVLEIPGEKLQILVVKRRVAADVVVLTAAVVNTRRAKPNSHKPEYSSCYFQVQMRIDSECGFPPIPERKTRTLSMTDEEASRNLIYRKIKNYAVGHGCAADWEKHEGSALWVSTRVMPTAETKGMKADRPDLDGVSLDMFDLGDLSRWSESKASMTNLCNHYEAWIAQTRQRFERLEPELIPAAERNLSECERCLARMRAGIVALDESQDLREAFCLANKAMLDQHLHYSVAVNPQEAVKEPSSGIRKWRPFQLAFLMMNIVGSSDPNSEDREVLDLIWFPTGGGKTEAYLGLSAFVLILERLSNEEPIGSTVIMRYTLRLLTTQQFQRAASLICALEQMRRKNVGKLGQKPFSIGLWLGSSTTPNNWEQAVKGVQKLEGGEESPFPVECCPWCGTPMGKRAKANGTKMGFEITKQKGRGAKSKKKILFECPDPNCDFHGPGKELPYHVVDEDVYENPPSLLIGTIDKFAMIPYRPESFRLFGIDKDGSRKLPPKLIIQDELHLISGPLGSMAANFETLVNELCSRVVDGKKVGPKIVASTATISRAKEQCNELFACGPDNVFQFPPSGVDYDDSFFAREEKEGPGRRYVGVYSPNLSFASSSISLYANLLWAPVSWEANPAEKDPYWTTVGYYGTVRELGQAATWASADIPERLKHKHREDPLHQRYLNRFIELTGRIDASEVSGNLKQIEVQYPDKECVDLCLATNMISVGLDVSRLGLMVVAGQPKSTSEYIQATSRVGRSVAKGIVFVLYGTQRPRDRSHYENFKNFHESLYCGVEPTSLTGFCEQVRERSMAGTFIGLCRSLEPDSEDGYKNPTDESVEYAKSIIEQRVKLLDPGELEDALKSLDEDIVEVWRQITYQRWSELNSSHPDASSVPLMYPRGSEDCWEGRSFAVPTSLRSVEPECKVVIAKKYGSE